jgi:hypothetical protein
MKLQPGERPPHFNPEAPTEDYVPLAAAAVGLGILVGTVVVAVSLLGVRGLVAQAAPTDQPDPMQPAGLLLILGTFGGCVVAATTCFAILAPLPTYRRGGLSMVVAFATFVVALLLAPVYQIAGPLGLGLTAMLATAGAWALSRRVRRLRTGV